MVQLLDLPKEILSQCVSYLVPLGEMDDYEDEADEQMDEMDLSNLCLVSRKLRNIAQPLLFSNFEDLDTHGDLRRLMAFTKVIISHPELAEHVQSISLTPLVLNPLEPFDRKLPAEDLKLFTKAMRDLQVPSDQENAWLFDLEFRNLSFILALLLSKTPNLRNLTLPGAFVMLKATDYLFTRNPSCLPNLNRLRIEGHPEVAFSFGIHMYEKFCSQLPVKTLEVQNGMLTERAFPASWTPDSLSVEDICLTFCDIDRKSITKLLQACKSVKSFVWTNWSEDLQLQDCLSEKTMDFDGNHLHAMLLPHKSTLKNLQLLFGDLWDHDQNGVYLERAKFPSFRDFTALDTLYISHRLLPPNPEFPPSLEKIIVGDCSKSIREWTRKFAADCHNGCYPSLRCILVLAMDLSQPVMLPGQIVPVGEQPVDAYSNLQNLFKGTTVDFRIMPYNVEEMLGDHELDDYDDYDDLEDGLEDFRYGPGGHSGRFYGY